MKDPPQEPPAAQPELDPELDPDQEWMAVLLPILESLTTIGRWVENVNTQLAQLGSRGTGKDGRSEREVLQEELDKVLKEIARVKSDAAEDLQRTEFRRELGKLRIRQTKLLLRMGSNPNSDSKDDDLFGLLR